jgi:hypothetical protein
VCTNPTSNQSLSTKVHILPAIEGFQLIGLNQMYISDISSTIHKTFCKWWVYWQCRYWIYNDNCSDIRIWIHRIRHCDRDDVGTGYIIAVIPLWLSSGL